MNEEQNKILNYLNENAVGKSNIKTSTTIRETLNLESGGATNEHIRELIRDMILKHGCCIGSSKGGYWIIQNEEELNNVCESLKERAYLTSLRATKLRENWTK